MMNEAKVKRCMKSMTARWGYIIQRNECTEIRPIKVRFRRQTLREALASCEWGESPVAITYNMQKVMLHADDLQYLEDTVVHEVCHIPTKPWECEPVHNGHFTRLYRKYSAMI